MMHVIVTETAKEAWGGLERFHRTQDMASQLWLKQKFASFKYTATDMKTHVTQIEQIVMEMTSAGCAPSEDDVCATILRSLPSSYESLVQAFRMSVMQFTFSDLVSKIIAEELRQKDASGEMEETALCVRQSRVKGKFGEETSSQCKKDVNVRCYKCGRRGHLRANAGRRRAKMRKKTRSFSATIVVNADTAHATDGRRRVKMVKKKMAKETIVTQMWRIQCRREERAKTG